MWIIDVPLSEDDPFPLFQMQTADPHIFHRQQEQELRVCSVLWHLDSDTVVFDTTGAEKIEFVVR